MARQICPRTDPSDFDERKLSRLLFTRDNVRELFDEEELTALLGKARRRVIGTFVHEREPARGKWRSTDNYVIGVGPRQSELADYVVRRMKPGLLDTRQYCPELRRLKPSMLSRVVTKLETELVLMALNELCSGPDNDVYFDEARGIWQVKQSAVDGWRESADRSRPSFVNDRSFHGRVRSQSKDRGLPAGLSVGIA